MSDTAPKNQPPQSSSGSQITNRPESPPSSPGPPPASLPISDGQATVITNRSPLPVSSASDAKSPFEKWGLMPGDRLGHFELIDYVGGGGMGRVFRAHDTRLAREVALKVLSPDQAADPNTVLRFQNEAQSAARLDHQNIARVHYVGEDRGIPFIVFEFIEGVNVRELVLKKGPLPLPEAISYMLQITEGLAHAASRNVVHRDIKPSNILITADGVAKLIDLGLARLQRLDAGRSDLTASGVTLGTFDYISPEQARDPRGADVRSDIYSLGCTLFFILTGRPPFPEGTVLQKLLHHQSDPPPDIRDFRPDAPEAVGRLLRRMMAKDPRQRHQTPAELAAELADLASQVGLELHPSQRSQWAAAYPRKPRRWLWHLPWVLPVLILVAVLVALEWSSNSDESNSAGGAPSDNAAEQDLGRASSGAVGPAVSPGTLAPRAALLGSSSNASPAILGSAGVLTSDRASSPAKTSTAGAALGELKMEGAGGGISAVEPNTWGIATAGIDRSPSLNVGRVEGASAIGTAPETPSSVKQPGVLVVGDSAAGERGFATLAAACGAAVSGNSIELRYQGRRVQQSVSLGNLKVTIRGADKYQPVMVFRPTEADRKAASHGMIRLAAGNLTLINVALELEIPRELSGGGWSLFELLGADTIRLERCSLTIRTLEGSLGDDAPTDAFFHLRTASAAGPATIELEHCVARGDGVFVRTETPRPLVLSWDNGLLVTSQWLLSATGNAETSLLGDSHQLDLRHLTAVTRGGLCRAVGGSSSPHLPRIRVQSSDCIFVGGAGGALIEQSSVESVADLRRHVEWSGNRNFYQDWNTFWRVSGADAVASPALTSFDAWLKYWRTDREIAPTMNQVQWKKLPEPGLPTCLQQPSDYALASVASNPARGAATDGEDAGAKLDTLTPLPPNP